MPEDRSNSRLFEIVYSYHPTDFDKTGCDGLYIKEIKPYEPGNVKQHYFYASTFPIHRAAIESRNKEIDILRDRLSNVTSRAMRNIMNERVKQDAKWGEQNHDPYTYLTILMEEVGEYAQACLHTQFGGNKGGVPSMREEAVQVAAVALAIIECLDRGKWKWPTRGG